MTLNAHGPKPSTFVDGMEVKACTFVVSDSKRINPGFVAGIYSKNGGATYFTWSGDRPGLVTGCSDLRLVTKWNTRESHLRTRAPALLSSASDFPLFWG